jgi:glycosyltransferase involved in cell wall biosynthesis
MKVLWFSNKVFSDQDTGSSGTWLHAMAHSLITTGKVELCNIAMGAVKVMTRQDAGLIRQWIVPTAKPGRDGLPSSQIVTGIIDAVNDFSPDIVHIWGTESYWGLLTARKFLQQPALLEMQGLKFAIAKVFHGGLSFSEQMSCVGLKEIISQSTIYQGRKRFEAWGIFEKEMIACHHSISVQTEWVEAQVRMINKDCQTFHTDLILRSSFYGAGPRQYTESCRIFCSAAYSSAFKGLHVAVRAIAQLKNRFPNIELRIAGAHQRNGIRQDGYIRWVNQQICRLGIEKQVCWLGPLSAERIVEEMILAAAMLVPAYIENCCTSMQEVMMLGTPIVASYVGGLPSLASDEISALFFSPGDEVMCAYQLERILSDQGLAEKLSHNARAIALNRNNPEAVVTNQLEIYRKVIADNLREHKS